jgi:hypothetical protein
MLSNDQKLSFAELFTSRLPTTEGDADVYLEVDSFQMFTPLDDGSNLARLALSSTETMDIAVNPVCAVRLAATLLDQLAKSGDFVVDLSIYDAETGDQLARVRPSGSIIS